MVREQISGRGIHNPEIVRVMSEVPRHLFVPDAYRADTYEDYPIPIGYSQTISQPYIVAYMIEALELKPSDSVLEVGVGSGYQAALLSRIVSKVYGIEIVPELAEAARLRLNELGYSNIEIQTGDGWYGWKDDTTFDAIIVAATATEIPVALVEQLGNNGRMILPVGHTGWLQQLVLVKKTGGEITHKKLIGVSFVPLVKKAEK